MLYIQKPEFCALKWEIQQILSPQKKFSRFAQQNDENRPQKNFRASRHNKKKHIFALRAKKLIFRASREKNPKNLAGFNRNFQGGVSH